MWLARRVEEAWVEFDFGREGMQATRVITGVGIKSSKRSSRDPESVVISYRPLDTSDADWNNWDQFPKLDSIDLAWEDDERMHEHKIALTVDG